MEAFRMAHEMGADGIELDVQLTRDGEIVVVHDEKIKRVTGRPGLVKDYTLRELKAMRFNRTHPEYADAQIPTLEEVLDFVRGTDMTVNIELKTGRFFYKDLEKRTAQMVREMGLARQVIYSSFNHYSVRLLKALDPDVPGGLLYSDGYIDMPSYAAGMGVDALHPAQYNIQYPHFMEDCRAKGLKVHVWTVNTEEELRFMYRSGVDAVITNYPDRARRVRAEMAAEGTGVSFA